MLHIIQNDPDVPPGNLTDNLAKLQVPFQLIQLHQGATLPPLSGLTALIVLGGAMGANDDARYPFLTPLKALIAEVVHAGIPYLGICLGGQLLAAALGTPVVSCRWEELGSLDVTLTDQGMTDRLFAGIPSPLGTFQWHHDSFDLPAAAVLLAASPACPHQAFRVDSRAWGLQFHPEVTEQIIRDWAAWDTATASRTETLLAAFHAQQTAYCRTAEQLLSNFLQTAGLLRCPA